MGFVLFLGPQAPSPRPQLYDPPHRAQFLASPIQLGRASHTAAALDRSRNHPRRPQPPVHVFKAKQLHLSPEQPQKDHTAESLEAHCRALRWKGVWLWLGRLLPSRSENAKSNLSLLLWILHKEWSTSSDWPSKHLQTRSEDDYCQVVGGSRSASRRRPEIPSVRPSSPRHGLLELREPNLVRSGSSPGSLHLGLLRRLDGIHIHAHLSRLSWRTRRTSRTATTKPGWDSSRSSPNIDCNHSSREKFTIPTVRVLTSVCN